MGNTFHRIITCIIVVEVVVEVLQSVLQVIHLCPLQIGVCTRMCSQRQRNLTYAMLSDGAGCSDNVVSYALHPSGENRDEIVQDDPLTSAEMSFAGNKRCEESTFQGVVVTVSSASSCNNHH